MNRQALKICIIDDEKAYFNESMLQIAAAAGYVNIERRYRVDLAFMQDLLRHPRDIVILDIRGIADPDVAKDGFGIASRLHKSTKTYVVVTSAHMYHLEDVNTEFDNVLEDRLLAGVDFVEVLDSFVSDYLSRRTKFYRKLLFKIGFWLVRGSVMYA